VASLDGNLKSIHFVTALPRQQLFNPPSPQLYKKRQTTQRNFYILPFFVAIAFEVQQNESEKPRADFFKDYGIATLETRPLTSTAQASFTKHLTTS